MHRTGAVVFGRADIGRSDRSRVGGRGRHREPGGRAGPLGLAEASQPPNGCADHQRADGEAADRVLGGRVLERAVHRSDVGYYEWTGPKGAKQPHFIHNDELLAAAGLTWTMDVARERHRVFVVVTREARDASGDVHDRMPAFLTPDLWDQIGSARLSSLRERLPAGRGNDPAPVRRRPGRRDSRPRMSRPR